MSGEERELKLVVVGPEGVVEWMGSRWSLPKDSGKVRTVFAKDSTGVNDSGSVTEHIYADPDGLLDIAKVIGRDGWTRDKDFGSVQFGGVVFTWHAESGEEE